MKESKIVSQLMIDNVIQDEFIVMNEDGHFFRGLIMGLPDWSPYIDNAKPLNNIKKFETLCRMCKGKELIYEYVRKKR